jgi:two-component sensor histidine kinase
MRPPVVAPQRRGFGSKFIVGSIASELGGTAALDFHPEGLRCAMQMPFEAAVETMQSEDADAVGEVNGTGHA